MPPALQQSRRRLERRPDKGAGPFAVRRMLSSFERPAAAGARAPSQLRSVAHRLSADLENCTAGANVNGYHRPGPRVRL